MILQQAQQILQQHFGYTKFRSGQEDAIQHLLCGRDALAIMPTGGGKSLCYQIPALIFGGLTIVVSPLISLMKDQVDALCAAGINATYINSTLSPQEIEERLTLAASNRLKMIYIAPERLHAPRFQRLLETTEVSLLAIDEAHCISQWGHDFRPSYLSLCDYLEQLPKRPLVIALTATATPSVAKDICTLLKIPQQHVVKTGFARDNLAFQVVKGQDKDKYLRDYLEKNNGESGIIYAATRKEVERIYEVLLKFGFQVGKYHGGLSDRERNNWQEKFLYDDISVIVATNAFGMGINKSNVRFVVHYNIPANMEAYYQEAGRAGRDGLPSDCILLFSPQDIHIQQFLIDQSDLSDDRKQNEYGKLREMTGYGYTEICLQRYIVQYFGEKGSDCDRCGNCLDMREITDITVQAQQVFSCIKRMGERFGKIMVAKVLTGSVDQRIKQWHFDTLSTHGLMKKNTQKEVLQLIDYLTAEKYLQASNGEFPSLHLTAKAGEVLHGKRAVGRKEARKANRVEINTNPHLFEALREVRRTLASEYKVPPYIIFSDEALKEMCTHLPKSKEEMLLIKGVGETKLKRYGLAFLEVLRNESLKR